MKSLLLSVLSPVIFYCIMIGCSKNYDIGTIIINPITDDQDLNGVILSAHWNLTGPAGYNVSGVGDTVLYQVNVGSYSINWGEVTSWVTPTPIDQELDINDTITFTGIYAGNSRAANAYLLGLAFANTEWYCGEKNQTASCSPGYKSLISIGLQKGVCYDWGGYMGISEFLTRIEQGEGAGSSNSDGILDCTAGVDASGFICQVWGLPQYNTNSLIDLNIRILPEEIALGDIWVRAGYDAVIQGPVAGQGKVRILHASDEQKKVCDEIVDASFLDGYIPVRIRLYR